MKNGYVWFYHSDHDFFRDFPDMSTRSLQRYLEYFCKLNIVKLKYEKTTKR